MPDKELDSFWHAHILDTMKYADDCEQIFGHFLHHFPYFGLRGEEDAQHLQDAFAETKRLYQAEFGEAYRVEIVAGCSVSSCDAAQCDPSECHNISTDVTRPTLVAA